MGPYTAEVDVYYSLITTDCLPAGRAHSVVNLGEYETTLEAQQACKDFVGMHPHALVARMESELNLNPEDLEVFTVQPSMANVLDQDGNPVCQWLEGNNSWLTAEPELSATYAQAPQM